MPNGIRSISSPAKLLCKNACTIIGFWLPLFLGFTLSASAQDTTQQVVPGRLNTPAQQKKPYLILISADGFRYDYADKYEARNLKALRASGVQAQSMQPSYPSVTFPNHYSVATGLYPSHHGLVYNQFYDRGRQATYNMGDRKAVEDGTWYGGLPIWALAELQGMVSASYHFVGTEAPIKGIYPTYWYYFKDAIPIDSRIATVVNWLKLPEEKRPHLITFYMSNADHAGHTYGPETEQTRDAVQFVDAAVGKLQEEVGKLGLPVNFIFLADHGMATVDTVFRMDLVSTIDTAKYIARGGGTSLHLYAKKPADIQPLYQQLKAGAGDYEVYLRAEIPAAWHYSTADDYLNRIGDILVVPRYPKVMSLTGRRISPGAHGFDPAIREMHASFYAWGPAFKKGLTLPVFENVHVYPLMCRILGLTYTHSIDGKAEVLEAALK